VILLTGATGTLGKPLLARLVGAGQDVRCLVREPRRLGPQRVLVQIAIGNLADRHGFDKALRGVDTVIHLAATTRDQARGPIEEVNGIGTARLLAAARRAGVQKFVYVSSIGASRSAPSRFIRTQALARDAVAASGIEPLIFDASIIYAPDDPWLSIVSKLSHFPLMPVPGDGKTLFQPIWADDAADAITSAILKGSNSLDHRPELVGPEVLTHDQILKAAMNHFGRRKPLLHLSDDWTRRLLRLQEMYLGPAAVATWDEAQLMKFPAVGARGTADLNALGVEPMALADVLPAR
jgi:NADH dehydrogenase